MGIFNRKQIFYKTAAEIEIMREAAQIVSRTLGIIAAEIKPGVTPLHLDKIADNYVKENAELQIFWENEIDLKIVNNDFLGPTVDSVKEYYKDLHLD